MSASEKSKPATLIASDRVEGTPVYRTGGKRIGTIKRVMIDKRRGTVAYAVMSFGGILGIGDNYYPLPWALLSYDEELGGYKVDVSDEQLNGAPKFDRDSWDFGDRNREAELFDYYGMPPYW
jgi:hypothetical protein